MDSIGLAIRRHQGQDQKVEVLMKESGKHIRMQAIDAREAIETRRGQLVGPILNPVAMNSRQAEPQLREDEIVAASIAAETDATPQVSAHPAMRPQPSRSMPAEAKKGV